MATPSVSAGTRFLASSSSLVGRRLMGHSIEDALQRRVPSLYVRGYERGQRMATPSVSAGTRFSDLHHLWWAAGPLRRSLPVAALSTPLGFPPAPFDYPCMRLADGY